MQAVSTTTGGRIVQSYLKIVVPQKPIERGPRLLAPTALSGSTVGLQACRNDRTGFNRLLIETGLFRFLGIEALRSDRHKMAFHLATLNRAQPIQGFEPCRDHLIVCGPHPCSNESLRQSRI